MKEYLEHMKQRADILRKAINSAEKESGTFPEGRLRISATRRQVRCYQVTESHNSSGVYLKKEKLDLAKALAQKDYNNRFINAARNELSNLNKAIQQLSRTDADMTYIKLSSEQQKLVVPYIQTDELFAAKWQAAEKRASDPSASLPR